MGFWDRLGLGRNSLAVNTTSGILSPWAPAPEFGSLIVSESLGLALKDLPMSRIDAMSIPAVARGRHLLVSTIAPLPLVALTADGGPAAVQPTFLYRSDTAVGPAERNALTIDSLIMWGRALWAVSRGSIGQILDAAWVPHDRWTVDSEGVYVDGALANPTQYLLFNGWNDGLLNTAARTLRGARAIEDAWVARATSPIPLTVIRHNEGVDGNALEQFEITDLLNQWRDARNSEGGALGYLPPGLTIDTHGSIETDLYENGRNALRVDIASFLGIPAQLLDGSVAAASLTYSTAAGNRNRFYDETLPLYTSVIEQRLSQDDVVPRGQRVRFDRTELHSEIPTPTGAPVED